MKKTLFVLSVLLGMMTQAWAEYSFSAVAPSGQTLYFKNLTSTTVMLTHQHYSTPTGTTPGYSNISGDLIIPEAVNHKAVVAIDERAFQYCNGITSVTIPNSVKTIKDEAFKYCSGMTSLVFTQASRNGTFAPVDVNALVSIRNRAFMSCTSLVYVNFGNFVESIWEAAFHSCTNLHSITIPESVDTLKSRAFYNAGLTDVVFNAQSCFTPYNNVGTYDPLDDLNQSPFKGCSNLTTFTLGPNVTRLTNHLFKGLNSITTFNYNAIDLSSSGWSRSPYQNFTPSNITLNIGPDVSTINYSIFPDASWLGHINVNSSNSTYDSRQNCNAIIKTSTNELIKGCVNTIIPNTVTSIWHYAFSECSGLTSVTIPSGVTSIGDGAFRGTSISKVVIPDSVNYLGTRAFANCCNLDTIYMMPSVPPFNSYGSSSGSTGSFWSAFEPPCENQSFTLILSGCYYDDYVPTTHTTQNYGWYHFFNNCNVEVVEPEVNLTINVTSNNATYGTASIEQLRGRDIRCDSTAVLVATPNSGYRFARWNDNNTQNPRTVTVRTNTTYTAYFEANAPQQYTITANSANTTMGTVTGGGTYNNGATATLTATPNSGYRFVRWQDNNTQNPRTITVTGNATYTAYFEAIPPTQYTITVNSNNNSWGSVSGGGTYNSGATATLRATPANGYRFVRWQDNNTQNPRNITVTANATYTAYFEAIPTQQYTITVNSNNNSWGTVSGGGTYNSGATATLRATPANGYRFVRWQDNNTQNPRNITVTANATYTAYFEAIPAQQYTITVNSNNNSWGTVSGGGTYNSGATATLRATPANGYRFVRWQDNNTSNPRNITVTANATYTAYFEANSTPTDPVDTNTCIITSFPYSMDFDGDIVCWSLRDNNQDGTTWQLHQNIGYNNSLCIGIGYAANADDWLYSPYIATPGNYTVSWKAKAYDAGYPETYIVYASGFNDATQIFQETITNTNFVDRQASFTVTAGDTVVVLFRYISDDMYYFFLDNIVISRNTTSIGDIVTENGSRIHSVGNRIAVEGAEDMTVCIYDMMGRKIESWQCTASCQSSALPSGVYLVQVGDSPARKIVIMN